MLLAMRANSSTASRFWVFRAPAAACFFVSSTLLPATLFYRHFTGTYIAGEKSLHLSKVGGFTALLAWFLLALC